MEVPTGRRRFAWFTLLTLVVLGAGCSDSEEPSGETAESTTTSATAAPTTQTSAPPSAADEARVRTVLLKAGDLPPRWVGSGEISPPTDDDPAAEQLAAECFGLPQAELDKLTADLESPTFTFGEAEISSNAYTAAAQPIVDQYQAALVKDGTRCLGRLFTEEFTKDLPQGVTLGPPDIRRTGPAAGGNGSKFTFAVTATNQATGEQLKISGGYSVASVDRLVIETSLITLGGDAPIGALDTATTAQYRRATPS
ncbi:MAG: hypothetical protein AB1679_17420 [Actinomycetota bacterium]|jgi:hypothetical protein